MAYKEKFNEEDGVWRTIGGRKVFIRKGQNLADAMIESGEFKTKGKMRESYRKEIDKVKDERKEAKSEEQRLKRETDSLMNAYGNGRYGFPPEYWGKKWNEARGWVKEEQDKVANYDAMLDKENTKTKQLEKSKAFDKEHGKAESLREQYRDEKGKEEQLKQEFSKGGKGGFEKYQEYKEQKSKNDDKYANIDDYLNRDKSKDKLNYNENTKEDTLHSGTFRKKEDTSTKEKFGYNDARDILNQLNSEGSDFTFGEIETDKYNQDYKEAGKLKAEVSVFMPDERGYTTRELEIPIDKNETRASFEEKLRDWQSRHSSPDTWEDEDFKSTNEKARKDAFDYSREEVTKAYETMRDKMQKHMDKEDVVWSGKEYTNAEFLAHLEDANWHGEMKQLREANLTPEQLTEIKDKTTLSPWGVGPGLTGKENVQKMIDSVKNKSTNETMNKAIREKASKKATKESTPNYSKYSADEQDILDGFGEDYGWDNPNKLQNLKEQIDYMRNPGESIRQTARRYATGGSGTMLIYTGDAEDYLKERNIKYNKDDPYSKYADVMAEQIEKLYNDASNNSMNNAIRKQANIKNAYKQYMKDHPESKMSLNQFKKMNK